MFRNRQVPQQSVFNRHTFSGPRDVGRRLHNVVEVQVLTPHTEVAPLRARKPGSAASTRFSIPDLPFVRAGEPDPTSVQRSQPSRPRRPAGTRRSKWISLSVMSPRAADPKTESYLTRYRRQCPPVQPHRRAYCRDGVRSPCDLLHYARLVGRLGHVALKRLLQFEICPARWHPALRPVPAGREH